MPPANPIQSASSDADAVLAIMGSARPMRWLRPDPIPDDLVQQVLWAATRASSANNTQPWDFVVVQEPETRRRIGELFLQALPPGLVDTARQPRPPDEDPTAWRTRAGAVNLMTTIGEVPVLIFVCGADIYPTEAPDPVFMYSALYAATQNALVAARALGLGAALTTLHRMVEPGLRQLLGIPPDRVIAATVPLGWPDRSFGPVTRRPVEEVVHRDRW